MGGVAGKMDCCLIIRITLLNLPVIRIHINVLLSGISRFYLRQAISDSAALTRNGRRILDI
jgi:hypothetical protein